MRILIVSPFFPPCNSVASLRAYSWAKYWSLDGHNVTVVSSHIYQMKQDCNLDCSSFKVIQTPSNVPFLYRKFVERIKSKRKGKSIENFDNKNHNKKKSLTTKIIDYCEKTGAFGMIRAPDWYDFWVLKLKKQLNPDEYDLVVSTAGPYGSHRIGLYIKKHNPKCKWIVDWRDLCSDNPNYIGLPFFRFYEKKLEKMFDNNADVVITVSEPLADIIRKRTTKPVYVIYNGFDSEYIDSINKTEKDDNDIFKIAYVGTIYREYQSPYPLLKAVSELKEEKKLSKKDIKLIFAGNCDCSEMVDELKITDIYKYLGMLPYTDALKLEYNTDALLFIEHGSSEVKGIMTAKIFEYLYTANEICSIGNDAYNPTRKLISDCNAGVVLGNDVEKIKSYLISRIKQKKTRCKVNYKKNIPEIMKYHRKNQARNLLKLIE